MPSPVFPSDPSLRSEFPSPFGEDPDLEDLEDLEGGEEPSDEIITEKICEAQDAFFEGDYNRTVSLAAKLMHDYNTHYQDVYDVMVQALVKLRRFEEAAEACSIWVDFFPPNNKSLSLFLETSYFASNQEWTAKAASELLGLSSHPNSDHVDEDGNAPSKPSWLLVFSSHILAKDLNPDQVIPESLSSPPAGLAPEEETKRQILLAWAHQDDATLGELVASLAQQGETQKANLAVAFALVGIRLFEAENLELEAHVAKGIDLVLEDSSNFKACQALLWILQEKEGMDAEIKACLLHAFEGGHMLVRKRVLDFLA